MNHIVDISTSGTRLSISNSCLCIELPKPALPVRLPLSEILCVIVSADAAVLTHAVLAELSEAGVTYIACNRKHMPCGMLLPYEANALQGERFLKQRLFSNENVLWQTLIYGKIKNAAAVLELWGRSAQLQTEYAERVKNGQDPNAIEAFAAKDSFSRLFEIGFSRRDSGHPENARLNYGYTVLRATVARFACASGLHPSFGVHHHNRYNAFALVDDLMEPFRPFIDHLVMELIEGNSVDNELSKEDKLHLSGGFYAKWVCGNQSRSLLNWIELSVRNWAQFIFGLNSAPQAAPLLMKPENFECEPATDDSETS